MISASRPRSVVARTLATPNKRDDAFIHKTADDDTVTEETACLAI
jgi:hypothetical protein